MIRRLIPTIAHTTPEHEKPKCWESLHVYGHQLFMFLSTGGRAIEQHVTALVAKVTIKVKTRHLLKLDKSQSPGFRANITIARLEAITFNHVHTDF